MDNNAKRALLFGAAVGGIFSLARRSAEKQKLTDDQLRSVNELKDAFVQVEALAKNLSLAPLYVSIKELEPKKKYQEIVAFLEQEIQKDAANLGSVKQFKTKLQYVLSGRFSEQRNNPKTHEMQNFFSKFKELPELLVSIIEKRTQVVRLLQRSFRYIEAGDSSDLRPEDKVLLQESVSEFNALNVQVETLLQDFK